MMVSLRWVIFINLGLTFLFFSRILAILKKKAGGKRPFFEFLPSRKFKKNKKQSGCFFIFLSFGNPQKKAGGKMPFFFFAHPGNSKKTKKTASCFWDFFHFLNFGNPQKESWWEESFFDFFEFSKRKLVGRVLFFEFFDFFEFGPFPERKLVGSDHFFLIFLFFLNLGHSQKGSWWEVFIFFDFLAGHIIF